MTNYSKLVETNFWATLLFDSTRIEAIFNFASQRSEVEILSFTTYPLNDIIP